MRELAGIRLVELYGPPSHRCIICQEPGRTNACAACLSQIKALRDSEAKTVVEVARSEVVRERR